MTRLIAVAGHTLPADAVQWVGPIYEAPALAGNDCYRPTLAGNDCYRWCFDIATTSITLTARTARWDASVPGQDDERRREAESSRSGFISWVWLARAGYLGPPREDVPAEWAETKDDLLNDAMHQAAMKSVGEGLPTRSLLGDTNFKPATAGATGYEPEGDPLPDLAWPEPGDAVDPVASMNAATDQAWMDVFKFSGHGKASGAEPTELW